VAEFPAAAATPPEQAEAPAEAPTEDSDAAAKVAPNAGMQAELQQAALAAHATASALLQLAHGELALSGALALRALLLAAIALACLLLAVAIGAALLVALGLSAGLGWPAALALSLLAILSGAAICLLQARRCLRGCGLARTRAKLASLLQETPS
jgi:uncharacterized membrane protein YqjE